MSCDKCTPDSGAQIFDLVKYNNGGHYSSTTGKFTAPENGYYLITAQILGANKNAVHQLFVDGAAKVWTDDNNLNI